ncbi:MAG: bifunctional folylpolyglutamate synthase/dihydrofolate synthase [Chloroflexota bacterium]|nr:bifunctional folylpolyglutamate synthase/dihydrofolate synthase [Chloroflexota bacterium]
MEYDGSLRWLLTLPDFERTGEFGGRPDLEPMRRLLAELGDPHLGRPTVHIAGSKGKGSTAVMIESVLEAAGRHTGTYISPHLHRYTERIRIDGLLCEREAFAAAMGAVKDAMDAVAGQFPERRFLAFDALTAAGFAAFRDAGVDLQIVEVGLGGALDSTNVFREEQRAESREQKHAEQRAESSVQRGSPHVVVLTPISLEHTAILGDSIAEIAAQKAGIITEGCAVIVAPQRESALDAFRAAAAQQGAQITEVAAACQMTRTAASADGQEFKLKTAHAMYAARLPLTGRHQLDNAATAIVACEALVERCGFELTPQHVRDGLAKVVWPGRLEVLKRNPLVIIDGAHNGDSAKRMVTALRDYFGLSHAIFLFGTLAGKDVASMSDAIAPMADHIYATGWPHARAADPRDVAAAFHGNDAPISIFGDLPAGYEAAVGEAGIRGAVVAFGSIAFVAALREYLLGIESDMIRLSTATAPDANSRP